MCQPPETLVISALLGSLRCVTTSRTLSPLGVSANSTSDSGSPPPPPGEGDDPRRLAARDRAGRAHAVLMHAAVGLRRCLIGDFGVPEQQFGLPACPQLERPCRQPFPPLLRFRDIGPNPLDRPRQQALEAHRPAFQHDTIFAHRVSPSPASGFASSCSSRSRWRAQKRRTRRSQASKASSPAGSSR